MKTVKPIDPRSQEWIEDFRNTPRERFFWPIKDPALDHYKARQAFEVDLIMDAALDKAIEENDIQYIIKHKELEAAKKQAESLESMAESLYSISLSYERNSATAEKQAESLESMAESLYSINLNYERNFK